MFCDSETAPAAHIKFESSLSGSDNCCITLSTAATEKIVFVWVVFAASSDRLFLFLVLHFSGISLYSIPHLSESKLATDFYKLHSF